MLMRNRPTDNAYATWKELATDEAFARLIVAMRRHATAVCIDFMGYAPDEVVNEAISKALLKEATHFAGRSKFSTWFHRLTTNTAHDYIRQRVRRRERSLEGLRERDFLHLFVSPQAAIEQRITLEGLRARMSPEDFTLLERLSEGATLKEIAEECHLKFRTLQTRWRRLRQRLQSEMMASGSTE